MDGNPLRLSENEQNAGQMQKYQVSKQMIIIWLPNNSNNHSCQHHLHSKNYNLFGIESDSTTRCGWRRKMLSQHEN